jgi:hypothetical protein
LGTYFLANYYTVFDYYHYTVSFAVNSRAAWNASIGNAADLTPSDNFTVELINSNNSWTGPLYVGTPQQ